MAASDDTNPLNTPRIVFRQYDGEEYLQFLGPVDGGHVGVDFARCYVLAQMGQTLGDMAPGLASIAGALARIADAQDKIAAAHLRLAQALERLARDGRMH
jgi:hypothetical protein